MDISFLLILFFPFVILQYPGLQVYIHDIISEQKSINNLYFYLFGSTGAVSCPFVLFLLALLHIQTTRCSVRTVGLCGHSTTLRGHNMRHPSHEEIITTDKPVYARVSLRPLRLSAIYSFLAWRTLVSPLYENDGNGKAQVCIVTSLPHLVESRAAVWVGHWIVPNAWLRGLP